MNYYHHFKNFNTNHNVVVRDIKTISADNMNIYEFISIIGKRANQIQSNLKEEAMTKKEEFVSYTDSIEEFQENQELIDISRAYEKLPNSVNFALQEYKDGKIIHRYPEKDDNTLFS